MRQNRRTKAWNKRYGASILKKTWRESNLGRRRKPLLRVLSPFRVVKAPNLKLLEKMIRAISNGKKTSRIFIRGNALLSNSHNCEEKWVKAPRGNLDIGTGKITWDRAPGLDIGEYEFLLYGTNAKKGIEKEGELNLVMRDGKNFSGWLSFEGKETPFENWDIPGKSELRNQLSIFIRTLIKKGHMAPFVDVRMRFVKWREEEGIEFFDLRGEGRT